MADLKNAADFANDPNTVGPLKAAMVNCAVEIMKEDPDTPHHTGRVVLAQQVISNPDAYAVRFAWAAATNPVLVQSYADDNVEGILADLQFVINDVWNPVAGIATVDTD